MKEDRLLAVMEKYQSEIEALQNVVGVAIGNKQSANKSLNSLCIKVYVSRKVPEEKLSSDQIIPKNLDGFETDVEAMEPLKAP